MTTRKEKAQKREDYVNIIYNSCKEKIETVNSIINIVDTWIKQIEFLIDITTKHQESMNYLKSQNNKVYNAFANLYSTGKLEKIREQLDSFRGDILRVRDNFKTSYNVFSDASLKYIKKGKSACPEFVNACDVLSLKENEVITQVSNFIAYKEREFQDIYETTILPAYNILEKFKPTALSLDDIKRGILGEFKIDYDYVVDKLPAIITNYMEKAALDVKRKDVEDYAEGLKGSMKPTPPEEVFKFPLGDKPELVEEEVFKFPLGDKPELVEEEVFKFPLGDKPELIKDKKKKFSLREKLRRKRNKK